MQPQYILGESTKAAINYQNFLVTLFSTIDSAPPKSSEDVHMMSRE